MPLTNSTYEAVMRRYDELRSDMRAELEARTEEIRERIPRIEYLEDLATSVSVDAAKARIADPSFDLDRYREAMREISSEKERLLTEAGYPADYLELQYSCPLCRDTGVFDGARCRCFNRIAAELIYGSEALRDILEAENFDTARFDLYPDSPSDPDTGETPRDTALDAFREVHSLAANIRKTPFNVYITGNTGVGKTFLSHAAAKTAADLGCSVLIFSSPELFDVLGDEAFGKSRGEGIRKLVSDCDLLVIDDLGTEVGSSFVSSELFRIVNSRLDGGKSTVISSNLGIRELSSKYSERISSRILSRYKYIRLLGNDIRISGIG